MKKLLCLLLAVMMLATCFVACGDKEEGGDNSGTTSNSNSADTDETTEVSTKYQEMLSAPIDMGGEDFYILQRWFGYGKATIDFQGEVIWAESEDGKMSNINLAKQRVLEDVQKAYNCTITGEIVQTNSVGEIRTMITEDIISRTKLYDVCFEAPRYFYGIVEEGNLIDLNTLGIDFSKPWWDNGLKDLSICNELYYALGDINTYDNDGTFVCFFNKDLLSEKYGEEEVEKIYELAANGEWTFDKLKSYVEGFGEDNGDGVRDEFDTYGLMTETSNIYQTLIASGHKIIEKNAQDEPEFALQDERVYRVITDTVELYQKSNDVLVANLDVYESKYGDGSDLYEKTVINGFKEGRGLFYICGLIHLPYLAEMDDDFGILPIPKFEDTQEDYHSTMSPDTSSTLFVTDNGRDFSGNDGKYLGIILDALGAYSKDYLTPEYYDKQLKRKNAPDPDSADMLDIIFENRTFDLGVIYSSSWGDILATVNALEGNIASRIAAQAPAITARMTKSVNTIKAAQEKN